MIGGLINGGGEDGHALGIAELAERCGVTQRAIRFYEDQGLLSPKRIGKTRIFGDRDRVRLDFILRGKRLGFSLAEIREWLDLYEMEDGARGSTRSCSRAAGSASPSWSGSATIWTRR